MTAGGHDRDPDRPDTAVRRQAMVQFGVAALIALLVLAAAAAWAARRAGTDEAVRDVAKRTELIARSVVEPGLAAGLAEGDPAAVAAMDELVLGRALGDDLVRVKIWDADGTVLYSDDPRLVGTTYPLDPEDVEALEAAADGAVTEAEAEISDVSKPENRFERGRGQLLEVYLPVVAADGEPLLFEAYFRYGTVTSTARRIWQSFAPIALGVLVLFALLQLPLAWRLSSRIVAAQAERERLLRAAVDASDLERRRIAADLHDGVVQDLTGVAYTLAGTADGLRAADRPVEADAVADAAGHTRTSIRALRSLLVEIYPPNLREAGIENALGGLLASLAARGLAADLRVEVDPPLSDEAEALVFRAAQEALRNVVKHARAAGVTVEVRRVGDRAVLEVADDGVGVGDGPDAAEGHVGLRVLDGLVAEAGGTVTVRSRPEGGTLLRVEVPT